MDITCEWSSRIDPCDTYPVADLDFRNEGWHRYYCRKHLNKLLDNCDYLTIADPMAICKVEPTRFSWVMNPEKLWCIFHAWPWVMCSTIDHRPLFDQHERQHQEYITESIRDLFHEALEFFERDSVE